MSLEKKYLALFLWLLVLGGCGTTSDAHRAPAKELAEEGSLVFVRPDIYTVFGTRSIRDYIEITYEKMAVNDAGQPTLQIGLRNRGGQHFWDRRGPEVVLSAKTCFYKDPISATGPTGPPTYETNWQAVHLSRGETQHYKVVCPYTDAIYYQVTLSELIR